MRIVSLCTDRVCRVPPTPAVKHCKLGIDSKIAEADEAYVIGKRGQYTPVGAYLAGDEIIKIAIEHGAQMIHPGYGFLSENAEFARKVEAAGLIVSVYPEPFSQISMAHLELYTVHRSLTRSHQRPW